jgi:queuine/archaeosine tRNA-ribosyltransferase
VVWNVHSKTGLMGVEPINILENIALGVDMCLTVMPTNARNGMLFTANGND